MAHDAVERRAVREAAMATACINIMQHGRRHFVVVVYVTERKQNRTKGGREIDDAMYVRTSRVPARRAPRTWSPAPPSTAATPPNCPCPPPPRPAPPPPPRPAPHTTATARGSCASSAPAPPPARRRCGTAAASRRRRRRCRRRCRPPAAGRSWCRPPSPWPPIQGNPPSSALVFGGGAAAAGVGVMGWELVC